jgi:hypothetical protein
MTVELRRVLDVLPEDSGLNACRTAGTPVTGAGAAAARLLGRPRQGAARQSVSSIANPPRSAPPESRAL